MNSTLRCSLLLLSVLSVLQVGCAHRQLRHDHVAQAKSLTTIYEQQVLDNLAMFYQNPDSFPFFAITATGSATVSDSGNLGASPLNGPVRTIIGPLVVSRANTQNWSMVPVTDSGKLERMQFRYQTAIASGNRS